MSVKQNTKKKLYFLSFFVAFFIVIGFFIPSMVHADVGDVVGDVVGTAFDYTFGLVIKAFLYVIFEALGLLVSISLTLFEWAINPDYYSSFLNTPATYEMWQFVRDFFNLFFILILLYIAFTVVFQIQKDFKKTLLSLVLAALFVNFSFPVSRALIDATNVPMYFFANQITVTPDGGHLGSVLTASGLEDILIPKKQNLVKTGMTQLIMAIIFMFIFGVTLLVLAIMFVIRMVVLVILVIFSSIGFAASVVPGLEQYSSKWWENFWKYAIFGPAAMLMILIATKFFGSLSADRLSQIKMVAGGMTTDSAMASSIGSMAMFSIPIIMLWMAMGLANEMSIYGASSVVGWGQKASKWAGKAPFKLGNFLERKVEKKLASKGIWTPRSFVEGYKRRSAEQLHDDEKVFHQKGAKIQDQLNGFISRFTNPIKSFKAGHGIDHTDHYSAEIAEQADKAAKHMSSISTNSDIVSDHLEKAIIKGDQTEILGLMKVLFKDNNENDAMEFLAKKRGFTKINSETVKHDFIKGILKEAGMSDENIAKQAISLSDVAIGAGNVAYAGMGRYNPDTHKYELTSEEDQAMIVRAKMKNMETQAQERMIHPDSQFERVPIKTLNKGEAIPDEYRDLQEKYGKTAPKDIDIWGHGDINGLAGQAVFDGYTKKNVGQINRSRGDRRATHANAYKNIENLPKFKELYATNAIVREYVDVAVADHNNPNREEPAEGKKKKDGFNNIKNKIKEQKIKNNR